MDIGDSVQIISKWIGHYGYYGKYGVIIGFKDGKKTRPIVKIQTEGCGEKPEIPVFNYDILCDK